MSSQARSDGGTAEDALSIDRILEILSNYQRREIIRHMRDTPGHVHSIDEVINHLRETEHGRNGESPGEDYLLSILVHIHGPKLEEADLLDYDVPSREVHYYPNERVERLLERIEATVDEFRTA